MEERLKQLWQLQEVDIKIEAAKKEIEKNLKTIEDLKSSLINAKEELKKKKEGLNRKKLKIKDLENDIKDYEEKIKKLVGQLYTLKSNEEYSALDLEIKNLKADKNLKEDNLLNFAMELDSEQIQLNKEEIEIKRKEEEIIKKQKEIQEVINKYNEEIAKHERIKNEIRVQIDSNLLSSYDRISSKKTDRKVLSYIKPLESDKKSKSGESSNTWVCGECNVIITMQELNMILLNKEIVLCRSCSRILDVQVGDQNGNQRVQQI